MFISSYPARENFGTQQSLRFADAQLVKTAELPSFAHTSSQFEVAAHSERLSTRDVPLARNPSMGTAQKRPFLVLKVVLHAVVVISEVLRLSTKSPCSRCCRHISTLNSQKLGPNDMSSNHTVTNFDEPAYETTRTSFPDHLGKCKKPPLAQCATKNHLGEAFPMRAQQGTGEINQEDHHERKSQGQRHRKRNRWRLQFKLRDPPLWDDGRGHHDENDRAK